MVESNKRLAKDLRRMAQGADSVFAGRVGEAADRLERHDNAYVNTDPVFSGVLARLKAVMDAHYPKELCFHGDGDYVGTAAMLLEKAAQKKELAPGSDLNIGTLIRLLHNQLRGMKSRREFSLAITKLQEAEMWYRQGLREIELDQQSRTALCASTSLVEDLVALVRPVYVPGHRRSASRALTAMFYYSGMPDSEAWMFHREIIAAYADPFVDRCRDVEAIYVQLAEGKDPIFPGLVSLGVDSQQYEQVFGRLTRTYGGAPGTVVQ